MTIGVDIQTKTSSETGALTSVFSIPVTRDCTVRVEVPAGRVGTPTTVLRREALEAARFAVAVLGHPDAVGRADTGSRENTEERNPSALEIAEQLRALAVGLAGNGQGAVAANALTLATIAARAEADGDSVSCVVNRLIGEH